MKTSLLFFLILLAFQTFGQSRQELETQRLAIEKKIEQTNQILAHTRQEQKNGLSKIQILYQQIGQRQNLIQTISEELAMLEKEISNNQKQVFVSQQDLQNYKTEYAAMVYMASKTNNALKRLSYLFAAKSFNQLLARLEYFEQYSEARKKQILHIQQKVQEIQSYQSNLEENMGFKKNLLQTQQFQYQNLRRLQIEYAQSVESLKSKEKELGIEFANQQNDIKALNELISEVIRKEPKEDNKVLANTPDSKLNENSFAHNKSVLMWPVEKGFVSRKFGQYTDPVFEKVRLENLGVDIRTETNAFARVVFAGKVLAVQSLPDKGIVVMVQHGEYYTVYANLAECSVKIGDMLKAKDLLGKINATEGISELQFQIWKNTQKLNPEEWLAN